MANDDAAAGQLTAVAERPHRRATDRGPSLDDGIEVAAPTEETVLETDAADAADVPTVESPLAVPRRAIHCGVAVIVALASLAGWFGFRDYQSHELQAQRSQFLQVARQGALNLTSIDWQHADADVQRILDGATGEFHDDFSKRSQPFVDIVKKFQSTSVGTISEAGLESLTSDGAQALVAVAVQTTNTADSDQTPRAWRMRISVQRVDDQIKVSNVEFVP